MRVVSADEALQTIGEALEREPRLRVLGVAGPGDALANQATLETFRRARTEFPALSRCISTNGLLLPDMIDEVHDAGITSLTITINAVDPAVGTQIYSRVRYQGQTYRDRAAFDLLNANQMQGLRMAAERGMFVKVNSVLIPGINDAHMLDVAREVKRLGAYTMNIIPMIPMGQFADMQPPSDADVNQVRDACEQVIQQFRNCMRCRADAIGVPGEEGCGGTPDTVSAAGQDAAACGGNGNKVCKPKFLQDKVVIPMNAKDEPTTLA
jgi:nitrogen fixation protein NifB